MFIGVKKPPETKEIGGVCKQTPPVRRMVAGTRQNDRIVRSLYMLNVPGSRFSPAAPPSVLCFMECSYDRSLLGKMSTPLNRILLSALNKMNTYPMRFPGSFPEPCVQTHLFSALCSLPQCQATDGNVQ